MSPELDSGFFTGKNEYRVARCNNIGVIDYTNDDILINDKPAWKYHEHLIFGGSKIFVDMFDALLYVLETYNKRGIIVVRVNSFNE